MYELLHRRAPPPANATPRCRPRSPLCPPLCPPLLCFSLMHREQTLQTVICHSRCVAHPRARINQFAGLVSARSGDDQNDWWRLRSRKALACPKNREHATALSHACERDGRNPKLCGRPMHSCCRPSAVCRHPGSAEDTSHRDICAPSIANFPELGTAQLCGVMAPSPQQQSLRGGSSCDVSGWGRPPHEHPPPRGQ